MTISLTLMTKWWQPKVDNTMRAWIIDDVTVKYCYNTVQYNTIVHSIAIIRIQQRAGTELKEINGQLWGVYCAEIHQAMTWMMIMVMMMMMMMTTMIIIIKIVVIIITLDTITIMIFIIIIIIITIIIISLNDIIPKSPSSLSYQLSTLNNS